MTARGPTTAWERTIRRREVIRLRLGKRMDVEDIAEETGYSESTIRKDFRWINAQVEKMQDNGWLEDYLMESALHLMDHEVDDLRSADREQDEKAKHRAKQSMRSTMKMLEEFSGERSEEVDKADSEYIENLPDDLKSGLEEYAGDEIEELLGQ